MPQDSTDDRRLFDERDETPATATDGWRVTATEQSRTTSQVRVTIKWERLWENGTLVADPSVGAAELTVKSGDRIPLDRLARAGDPTSCPTTEKNLELHVGRASSFATPIFSILIGEPGPEISLTGRVDAELWLVHRSPDSTETVSHQTVRLSPGGAGFLFRGEPVDTSDPAVAASRVGRWSPHAACRTCSRDIPIRFAYDSSSRGSRTPGQACDEYPTAVLLRVKEHTACGSSVWVWPRSDNGGVLNGSMHRDRRRRCHVCSDPH